MPNPWTKEEQERISGIGATAMTVKDEEARESVLGDMDEAPIRGGMGTEAMRRREDAMRADAEAVGGQGGEHSVYTPGEDPVEAERRFNEELGRGYFAAVAKRQLPELGDVDMDGFSLRAMKLLAEERGIELPPDEEMLPTQEEGAAEEGEEDDAVSQEEAEQSVEVAKTSVELIRDSAEQIMDIVKELGDSVEELSDAPTDENLEMAEEMDAGMLPDQEEEQRPAVAAAKTKAAGHPQTGWDVYLNGKWIEKVFYDADMTDAEEIKKSLVNHDGFNPGIVVRKEKKRPSAASKEGPIADSSTPRAEGEDEDPLKDGTKGRADEGGKLVEKKLTKAGKVEAAFMDPEIYEGAAYLVDGAAGVSTVPDDVVGDIGMQIGETIDNEDPRFPKIAQALLQYTEHSDTDKIWEIEYKAGWLARMSAPGYLDATEWTLYDTAKEAEDALAEDDDDDDRDDDDDDRDDTGGSTYPSMSKSERDRAIREGRIDAARKQTAAMNPRAVKAIRAYASMHRRIDDADFAKVCAGLKVTVEAGRKVMAEEKKHELKIKSLDDAQLECSQGDWSYSKAGAITREEAKKKFQEHLDAISKKKVNAANYGKGEPNGAFYHKIKDFVRNLVKDKDRAKVSWQDDKESIYSEVAGFVEDQQGVEPSMPWVKRMTDHALRNLGTVASNLETREYSDQPDEDAATIAGEVLRRGRSRGWQGTEEQVKDVSRILNPINIFYTDDMFGEWTKRARAEGKKFGTTAASRVKAEAADIDAETVLQHYLVAALWSSHNSTDDGSEPESEMMDQQYGVAQISPESLADAKKDVDAFLAYPGVRELIAQAGLLSESVGHDFWLTRQGHGAGFWDRGLGEVGDKLTEVAEAFREVDDVWGDGENWFIEGGGKPPRKVTPDKTTAALRKDYMALTASKMPHAEAIKVVASLYRVDAAKAERVVKAADQTWLDSWSEELRPKAEELAKLQDSIRGINIRELSNEDFEKLKKTNDRISELMDALYKFTKLSGKGKKDDDDKPEGGNKSPYEKPRRSRVTVDRSGVKTVAAHAVSAELDFSLYTSIEAGSNRNVTKEIMDGLNKKFFEIKEKNPQGFMDEFESRISNIMDDVAKSVGAVSVASDEEGNFLVNFIKGIDANKQLEYEKKKHGTTTAQRGGERTRPFRGKAWTKDGSDITPGACRLMELFDTFVIGKGWREKKDFDANKDAIVKHMRPRIKSVSKADLEVLSDYNYHFLIEIIEDTLQNAPTAATARRSATAAPYYSISDGMTEMKGNIKLYPGLKVPYGASSSPDNVYITKIENGKVFFKRFPFTPESRETFEDEQVFKYIAEKALKTKIKQYDYYIDVDKNKADPAIIQRVQDMKDLLEGKNISEGDLYRKDPEALARYDVTVKPKEGADFSDVDPWYLLESFGAGNVGGKGDYLVSFGMNPSDIAELEADGRLEIVEKIRDTSGGRKTAMRARAARTEDEIRKDIRDLRRRMFDDGANEEEIKAQLAEKKNELNAMLGGRILEDSFEPKIEKVTPTMYRIGFNYKTEKSDTPRYVESREYIVRRTNDGRWDDRYGYIGDMAGLRQKWVGIARDAFDAFVKEENAKMEKHLAPVAIKTRAENTVAFDELREIQNWFAKNPIKDMPPETYAKMSEEIKAKADRMRELMSELYEETPLRQATAAMGNGIKEGDLVRVNMDIVKRRDNIPQYLRLVRQAIKNAENGTPYVANVKNGMAEIRSWRGDILGDVSVPVEACTVVGSASTDLEDYLPKDDVTAAKKPGGIDVRQSGGKWEVVDRKDGDKVLGTHDTEEKARKQQKAIYASMNAKAENTENKARPPKIGEWLVVFSGKYGENFSAEQMTPNHYERKEAAMGPYATEAEALKEIEGLKEAGLPEAMVAYGKKMETPAATAAVSPVDIGDGYYIHKVGYDRNGNWAVWVSKGANRAEKIQTNGDAPEAHRARGKYKDLSEAVAALSDRARDELKEYHRRFGAKATKEGGDAKPPFRARREVLRRPRR